MEEKINPILFIDLETSGLNPDVHSILQIAGAWFDIYDHSVNPAFNFYIWESHKIVVDPKSMEINKLDLKIVKEQGLNTKHSVEKIREEIKKWVGNEPRKVFLAGHNTKFDISFLKKLYESSGYKFNDDFDYHSFDTSSVIFLMMMMGKIPEAFPKLTKWVEINGVHLDRSNGHSALDDILATAQGLKNFLEQWDLKWKEK